MLKACLAASPTDRHVAGSWAKLLAVMAKINGIQERKTAAFRGDSSAPKATRQRL